MPSVLELSYTGDLLAHRRCPRAWAFEKYAGFHPYEQSQAMEGRLVHHAMEWMTIRYRATQSHTTRDALRDQLLTYFRVLYARGMRSGFQSKAETIQRVLDNLLPGGQLHPTVRAAVEGASHTEYELRTIRSLIAADFAGKDRLMLTGILDLVVQLQTPLLYPRTWRWTNEQHLDGVPVNEPTAASSGDVEVWDYKATRAATPYLGDYARQLLTYAGLYSKRVGALPKRCVLFFVNEPDPTLQLIAIPIVQAIVASAEAWTIEQARQVRLTAITFEGNPMAIEGGDFEKRHLPVGHRVDDELKKQCTSCMSRFDCAEYRQHLGNPAHPDISLDNVRKN